MIVETFKIGDIVVLSGGSVVLESRANLIVLSEDVRAVVEAIRHFSPGSEDDHFTEGTVLDLRALVDGAYSAKEPILTIALSGDFEESFIHRDLKPVGHLTKTFIQE